MLPVMNALNAKLIYAMITSIVVIIAAVWVIEPWVRECGFQMAGLAAKPLRLAGRSRDPYRRGTWNQLRFYNYRRSYRGEHRGFNW
jgi:hypothetical protein